MLKLWDWLGGSVEVHESMKLGLHCFGGSVEVHGAYFMLNFVRRYLKKLMRYFNFEKWSELVSSMRFQRRTTFRDIVEKYVFGILLTKFAKRQLYSSRLLQLKNYLCMFFRSVDIGRRQRIKKTHYVIRKLITS